MPNRNPYTNSNAISNSGANYFTNRKSKILKLNLNLIENADLLQEFLLNEYKNQFNNNSTSNSNSNSNTYLKKENDFLAILQYQKTNSKLNKLK